MIQISAMTLAAVRFVAQQLYSLFLGVSAMTVCNDFPFNLHCVQTVYPIPYLHRGTVMGFRPKKITICFYTLGNKNIDHMAFLEQHALNISFVIF